jgi:uncharacterized protein (DUF2141 family)
MGWKIAAGIALTLLMTAPAQAGELKVTIVGVRSDAGAVMIGLYDSAAKFKNAISRSAHVGLLSDKDRLIGVTMRARTGDQGIGFMLPPGRYALIVIHDENDNALLDTGTLGIPTEGYGFSNNAMGFFSAPDFDAAAVTVGPDDKSTFISLSYPVIGSPLPRGGKVSGAGK